MNERTLFTDRDQQQETPEITMDLGVGRHLEDDEFIEVHDENLQAILAKIPSIDPTKIRLRLVGFYDREHAISQPDEEGIVTITLPARNAAQQLPLALSDYAGLQDKLSDHSSTSEALKTVGEAASDIVDRTTPVMGSLAMGAFPQLLGMTYLRDIGQSLSSSQRSGRKLAKASRKSPAFSIKHSK